MAVFRIEKTRDYTVMSNYHLRDMSLSLKAKGLLSLMLSLPENWDYTMKGLADYFVPPYSFRYPYYNLNGAFWPHLRIFAKEKRHELPVHSVPYTVFNFLPRRLLLHPVALAPLP